MSLAERTARTEPCVADIDDDEMKDDFESVRGRSLPRKRETGAGYDRANEPVAFRARRIPAVSGMNRLRERLRLADTGGILRELIVRFGDLAGGTDAAEDELLDP